MGDSAHNRKTKPPSSAEVLRALKAFSLGAVLGTLITFAARDR
jgi:hypothetical protein